MEFFKNKFLMKLIIVIFLILTAFMLGINSKVYADEASDKEIEGWGGVLVKPVMRLVTGIGDAIMEVLERHINDNEPAFIPFSGPESLWNKWKVQIITAIAFAVIGLGIASLAAIPLVGAVATAVRNRGSDRN